MRKLIVIILICGVQLASAAQENPSERLEGFEPGLEDSARIKLMIQLANECRYYQPDNILRYNEEALQLSEKANYDLGSGLALKSMGNYYTDLGNYDSAMHYFIKAEQVFLKLGNKKQLAAVIGKYCHICIARGEYNKALEAGFSALQIAEESGDSTEIRHASQFIGYTYYFIGNTEQAFIYLERALILAIIQNDIISIGTIYNEMAAVYELDNNRDLAIEYYLKASEVLKGTDDKRARGISIFNLAEAYRCQKNYKNAIIKYHESYKIMSRLNDRFGVIQLVLKLSDSYIRMLESGEKSAMAVSIIRQMGYKDINDLLIITAEKLRVSKNKNDLLTCYALLAELNKLQKKFPEAYAYNSNLIALKDTLAKANKANVLAEMLARFEKWQHEKKLELIEAQSLANEEEIKLQRQKQFIILLVASLLIILGFGLRQRITTVRKTKTKLEDINEQLENEKIRAEKSERFKEKFLTHVSHEIRTPMNAIMGITNILIKNKHYKSQEKYLDAMNISSKHLLGLINDILDLSKLESGKAIVESQTFSIHSTITQLIDELSNLASKKGIQFLINYDDNIPDFVRGDQKMLYQILNPLCRNGIEYTSEGGVTLLCKLNGLTEKMAIVGFTVKDTGSGIDKALHDKLFQQVLGEAKFDKHVLESSGIELILIKQMVELQGGTISFDSDSGKGTTFYFEIPYEIAPKDGNRKNLEPDQVLGDMPVKGISVLLVEDNEFNIMVAKEELESAMEDISIDVATNGKIAVENVSQKAYDIILMDIQMPVMDGYKATRLIREMDGDAATIPIIAMTANIMKSEVDKCFEAGMNGYVSKPFDVNHLLNEMKRVLKR